ncbi:GPN-loop GTPase 1-like [Tachypleus tridentatus]|uniref:GPN-loop GTPase 1-like n=1 Tax=Tachypleus tridentatus TaxID=6853 RepID=UPI003FD25228
MADINQSKDSVESGMNNPCTPEASEAMGGKTSGRKPTCMIVLGMAGSGKTTWVQRITAHLYAKKKSPYVINLDPACKELPYPANIGLGSIDPMKQTFAMGMKRENPEKTCFYGQSAK